MIEKRTKPGFSDSKSHVCLSIPEESWLSFLLVWLQVWIWVLSSRIRQISYSDPKSLPPNLNDLPSAQGPLIRAGGVLILILPVAVLMADLRWARRQSKTGDVGLKAKTSWLTLQHHRQSEKDEKRQKQTMPLALFSMFGLCACHIRVACLLGWPC